MHALELHAWGAKGARIERPDTLIFDLDPIPDCRGRWSWRERGEPEVYSLRLGLVALVQTTGGKGVHVVVPLQRRHGWDEVKDFAQGVAARFEKTRPDQFGDQARYAATARSSSTTCAIRVVRLRSHPIRCVRGR